MASEDGSCAGRVTASDRVSDDPLLSREFVRRSHSPLTPGDPNLVVQPSLWWPRADP